MPCCDVTARHYYSQLMTTAHAARFTKHGQLGIVTCYRRASSPTGHAPCSVKQCKRCRATLWLHCMQLTRSVSSDRCLATLQCAPPLLPTFTCTIAYTIARTIGPVLEVCTGRYFSRSSLARRASVFWRPGPVQLMECSKAPFT